MNPKLLEPEVQRFIKENINQPVTKLALQKNPFHYIEWKEVINQIAARQKAKDKLPTWYNTDGIIYPAKISIEQTSSEVAAKYKASLVSGKSLIDITGGLGIDDYYFSENIDKVTHCELNLELSAIAAYNFKVLDKSDSIECLPGDSTNALGLLNRQFDWMYIDPSRRSDVKGKVFLLKDCLPNVPGLLDFYFRYTKNILIKTAPLLDISAGLNELHSVEAIHIIAINNEVKELLWVLNKGFKGTPLIEAVNITKEGIDNFCTQWQNDANATVSLPQKYLYEPNSAVMKTGAFNAVSSHYGIDKLHTHTHLYTAEKLINFSGRRFTINEIIPYSKQEIKKHIEGKKMNVTTRNFPLNVTEIKKKWKIKDGGDTYAFFTTDINNDKIVLLCSKI